MPACVLGLDIGGANLKAAHSSGAARLISFPLWKNPGGLPAALRALLDTFPPFDFLAVTMTGELCDCFETKRAGVDVILNAVANVARDVPIQVWQTTGQFVDPNAARAKPLLTAASNWLALAIYAGRHAPTGPALVLDIGSTTTDIIPLSNGRPVPRGRTDRERLHSQELVYTGVRRTPLCALLKESHAAEFFATTQDAYIALRLVPEDPKNIDTADGRPASRDYAHARLARMLCADMETCTEEETTALAQQVLNCQVSIISKAMSHVAQFLPEKPASIVLAGSGEFLGRIILAEQFQWVKIVSLEEQLGQEISSAACAYALAVLAAEGEDHGA